MPRSANCLPIATSTDAAYRARALYHHSTYARRVSSVPFRHAHVESPWPSPGTKTAPCRIANTWHLQHVSGQIHGSF
jgi:hypothetical protein